MMITLYTFGPSLGLPDPSPFVMKAMLLLKMAGLQYETDSRFKKFRAAPKGKLPYLDDDGVTVADSYFIRRHIETKYGFDFDSGLDARAWTNGFAVEKMLEDTFYWAVVYSRWIEPQNWPITKAAFFGKMPAPMSYIAPIVGRRQVKRMLHAQGLGRHRPSEIRLISDTVMRSLSEILSDRPYLLGDGPCGADATVLAFLLAATSPAFASSVVEGVADYPNLIAYRDRLRSVYFAA